MKTTRASQTGPATGLLAQALLLAVLVETAALGAAGWIVGTACAVTMAVAPARGLARFSGDRLGPPARATLAIGVVALAADSLTGDTPVALLVTLAGVALVLDAVDGWVARRTGMTTALGARFDGEVDAFLILALSVYVAPAYGAWVLAIGAARYGFLAAGWLRGGIAVAITVLALLLVWAALVAPNQPSDLTLGAFARLPLELLVVVALAAVLPAAPRRVLAVVAGVVLSLLVLVKVLDIGFFTAFDRPFQPLDDSGYVGIGIETLRNAIGRSSADLVVAVPAVLIVALLTLPVLALLRVTRIAAGHRGWALRAAMALGVVWVALRVAGAPVASSSTAALAVDEVQAIRAALADPAALAREIAQ